MEAILQEPTIDVRREKLSETTDGLELGDVYGATIERIKMQGGNRSRLGMAALMWISHAERRLTVQELCHALAVHPDSKKFRTDNIPSVTTFVTESAYGSRYCTYLMLDVSYLGSTIVALFFLPCTFLICYSFLLGYLFLSSLIAFATLVPFRQPYAFLLVLLD